MLGFTKITCSAILPKRIRNEQYGIAPLMFYCLQNQRFSAVFVCGAAGRHRRIANASFAVMSSMKTAQDLHRNTLACAFGRSSRENMFAL